MTEERLKFLVNLFTIIATVVLFALILLIIFQFINQTILSEKKKALENELNKINTQIEYYEEQNELLTDDDYLEQYAREYYDYGRNGERKYTYN